MKMKFRNHNIIFNELYSMVISNKYKYMGHDQYNGES